MKSSQGLSSLILKICKDEDCTTSLGNPSPCLACLSGKKVSSHLQPEPFLFLLVLAASHPPTMHHCEEPGSMSSRTPLQGSRHLGAVVRSPQIFTFSSWTSHNTWVTCSGPPLNSQQICQCISWFCCYLLIYNSSYHKVMGKIKSQNAVMSSD